MAARIPVKGVARFVPFLKRWGSPAVNSCQKRSYRRPQPLDLGVPPHERPQYPGVNFHVDWVSHSASLCPVNVVRKRPPFPLGFWRARRDKI